MFKPGDRVELHPGLDLWMRGARYGDVVSIGRTFVTVQLDKVQRPVRILPHNLTPVPRGPL